MEKCETCGKEFATEKALAQHLKDKHGIDGLPETSKSSEETGAQRPGKSKAKSLRRRNRHPVAIGLAAAAIVVGLGLYLVIAPTFATPPFPCIATQNYYIHIHPYLQIWVNGANVTIPSQEGITQSASCLEPIHTHDASGILHVELSQAEAGHNWTLGDFFTMWKYTCSLQSSDCPTVSGTTRPVVFNQTDIFGYKADATHKVVLLVNGAPSSDWGNLNLEKYDYCSTATSSTPPCGGALGTAQGDPAWKCLPSGNTFACGTYPYTTGNKIVIEYTSI